MKLMMSVILMIGLATAGVALLAQARSIAGITGIVSGITHLRQENNLKKCEEMEAYASRQLRSIRDSFVPVMWLGGLTAVLGLAGLIVSGLKRKEEPGQPPPAN